MPSMAQLMSAERRSLKSHSGRVRAHDLTGRASSPSHEGKLRLPGPCGPCNKSEHPLSRETFISTSGLSGSIQSRPRGCVGGGMEPPGELTGPSIFWKENAHIISASGGYYESPTAMLVNQVLCLLLLATVNPEGPRLLCFQQHLWVSPVTLGFIWSQCLPHDGCWVLSPEHRPRAPAAGDLVSPN